MNTLSATDKDHLNRIAETMNWTLIARVMKAMGWTWYFTNPHSPTAGQVRDEAINCLTLCIHHARRSPYATDRLLTGGLEYVADVCPDTGQIESLRCAFVLEACDSADEPTKLSFPTR